MSDQPNMRQREGHTYGGVNASDFARIHNGDHYGPVNHYTITTGFGDLTFTGNSKEQLQNVIATAMDSLSFTQMDIRQASIWKAHTGTCKWIFDRPEYKNWRDPDAKLAHNGCFWIKSKPGAGKSTMMKFFLQSASEQIPQDVVISFFFNARGETLERSLVGLYRSLLYQLLTAVPHLQTTLTKKSTSVFVQRGWPLDSLKTIFSQAVHSLGEQHATCFVDALDECTVAEMRDMVEFFEDLSESTTAQNVNFSICFASRHYPQVTMKKCQQMILDGEDGHREDISKYIQSKLKVQAGRTAQAIRTTLKDKAQGVFMWVVIVVRILNEHSDRGGNNAALQECLNQLPSELHDLFEGIFARGMQGNNRLIPILQWLSFAGRPLTRQELYFALCSENLDFDVADPWDPDDDTFKTMDLFLLHASKGLVEQTTGATPTMQFIHESVRNFLDKSGFHTLAPELSPNLPGLSHDYLKSCYLAIIDNRILNQIAPPSILPGAKSMEARALRERASMMFPFLKYAVTNLVFHAESACSNKVPQSSFFETLDIDTWRKLSSIFATHDNLRYSDCMTVPSILARKGALHLLETVANQTPHTFGLQVYSQALHHAIIFGHLPVVMFLLRLKELENLPDTGKTSLLNQAITLEDGRFFNVLLNAGFLKVGDRKAVSDLLVKASQAANLRAIQTIVEHDVDVPSNGAHALSGAAKCGSDLVVRALLKIGVRYDPSDRWSDAFHIACRNGHAAVVSLLLRHGAQINQIRAGETPLSEACRSGQLDAACALLKNGADFTLAPTETPLLTACRSGHHNVVNMLLSTAGFIDIRNEQLCLEYAFRSRNRDMIQVLLKHDADLDALWMPRMFTNMSESPRPRSLIFAASSTGDEDGLALLFEYKADPMTSKGQEFHDALLHACCRRRANIVQILLHNGAVAPLREAEYYRTLIQEATKDKHGRILSLLFEQSHGCCAQEKDLYVESLRLAIDRRYNKVVSILNEKGIKLP